MRSMGGSRGTFFLLPTGNSFLVPAKGGNFWKHRDLLFASGEGEVPSPGKGG